MAKKNDKKKDGDLDKELKQNLLLDIEILENKIFIEQEKELRAREELDKINKELHSLTSDMASNKLKEDKHISKENDDMRVTIEMLSNTVENLQKSIRDYDDDIKVLEKSINVRADEYKRELEEKDAAINEQRKLFEDMSVRFQHILQRTANKLQERVNMGA
jgi:hypothetical protein